MMFLLKVLNKGFSCYLYFSYLLVYSLQKISFRNTLALPVRLSCIRYKKIMSGSEGEINLDVKFGDLGFKLREDHTKLPLSRTARGDLVCPLDPIVSSSSRQKKIKSVHLGIWKEIKVLLRVGTKGSNCKIFATGEWSSVHEIYKRSRHKWFL